MFRRRNRNKVKSDTGQCSDGETVEESEEKEKSYQEWLAFPDVSKSLRQTVMSVLLSNTVHVFYTERSVSRFFQTTLSTLYRCM